MDRVIGEGQRSYRDMSATEFKKAFGETLEQALRGRRETGRPVEANRPLDAAVEFLQVRALGSFASTANVGQPPVDPINHDVALLAVRHVRASGQDLDDGATGSHFGDAIGVQH
jgi:hypothetical protein